MQGFRIDTMSFQELTEREDFLEGDRQLAAEARDVGFSFCEKFFDLTRSHGGEGSMMQQGDLCGFCLRPSCAGDAITCPRRFDGEAASLMAAQTLSEVRAMCPTITMCGFCYGQGGYRVPCHGCGVVGPVAAR